MFEHPVQVSFKNKSHCHLTNRGIHFGGMLSPSSLGRLYNNSSNSEPVKDNVNSGAWRGKCRAHAGHTQGTDGFVGPPITMIYLALLRAVLFVCDVGESVSSASSVGEMNIASGDYKKSSCRWNILNRIVSSPAESKPDTRKLRFENSGALKSPV
ncbi:hypothetical protein BPOR_0435g00110 [Botrytis porri]|uniref:Uncharacterized protein n=1 Tax=Botrytis porri TaxID=87229 RepID=A0A4Z1KHP3_9HELO|nr:hypothetical protein BPOR_0435g00110 [Botrytis porri]